MDEITEKEEYMVTVGASRQQGDVVLFDSEHRHQNFISLRISSAHRERSLSHDWVYDDKELIEVRMSESQWAAMISSLNYGSGVPATLQHLQRVRVEQPVLAEEKTDKFSAEMEDTIEAVVERLVELKKGKHTKATQRELDVIISHLRGNIGYVADQFDRHMEERVDKAKTEIEAHMNSAVQRAGFEVLIGQGKAPLMIEEDIDESA